MSTRETIINRFGQQQEKYVYYLIALSVTAIGFSIINTNDQQLTYSQIPLAFAILFWGYSIYSGLNFLQYIIGSLSVNKSYLDILNSDDPKKDEKAKNILEGLEKVSQKTKKLIKFQNYFFYSGILSYLIWHIIEMYKRTLC